jgi:hypothetical protein
VTFFVILSFGTTAREAPVATKAMNEIIRKSHRHDACSNKPPAGIL